MLQRRPITALETETILAALARASLDELLGVDLKAVQNLRVVSRCDCGCDSVDFDTQGSTEAARRIADGLGTTRAGGAVGILIWAKGRVISGLEVYDLGAGETDIRLPLPSTIRPWSDMSAG